MIQEIASKFRDNKWTWSLKGRGHVIPDEEDIENALDAAAGVLYTMEDGKSTPQISMGHLIIKRGVTGKNEVYIYVGEYI